MMMRTTTSDKMGIDLEDYEHIIKRDSEHMHEYDLLYNARFKRGCAGDIFHDTTDYGVITQRYTIESSDVDEIVRYISLMYSAHAKCISVI